MIKNKKILLTGGCGFLGTHLTSFFCDKNDVLLLDVSNNLIKNTNLLNEK